MYGVTEPAELAVIKEAGFNCFQAYNRDVNVLKALAAEAAKQHLKTVFYPDQLAGEDALAAREWPVLAWYLVDEPDVWNWPRERVIAKDDNTHAQFPNHQTALVIGQGQTAVPYYDIADALMVDWYPVPHLPLESFGEQVALARKGLERAGQPDKPLWGVVQSFNWKEFKQHRPDHMRVGRFPEQDEMRFMSYHGIVNGATGLFYFVYTTQGRPLPQAQPEWWARVRAVSKELAEMVPVFADGKTVKNPAEVSAPLLLKTWKYKGKKYAVLVNASKDAQPVPAKLLKKKYKVLSGPAKTEQITPYGVWVLTY